MGDWRKVDGRWRRWCACRPGPAENNLRTFDEADIRRVMCDCRFGGPVRQHAHILAE